MPLGSLRHRLELSLGDWDTAAFPGCLHWNV